MMANKNEITSGKLESKFNAFLGANKKVLIIVAVAIVVAVLGLWIGLSVADNKADAAQLAIDNLQATYSEWNLLEDQTTDEAMATKEALVGELSAIASKSGKSYPVLKATYLLGLLKYEDGAYAEALDHFVAVSQKGSGTYLGSLGLFNAGVASEQLGNPDKAMEYYQSVYDTYGADAAEAPKALFSIARLHETNNNIDLAKAVLQQLADEFTASEYAKLAKSRLVVLQ
jgi:tetratricopeptide (TPR) repeat protein